MLKDLNSTEFIDAPDIIKNIYILSHIKNPISSKMLEDAMKEYPEYFIKIKK
jgi:hypothetical protein